jgi:hypothetical protein
MLDSFCFYLHCFAQLCLRLSGPHCPKTGKEMRLTAIGNAFIYHELRHLRPPFLNNDVINIGIYIHYVMCTQSLNVIRQC